MSGSGGAPLQFDANKLALWSIILFVLVTFLVVARPLVLPLAIAFLLWGLLDAIRSALITASHGRFPLNRAIATTVAILVIAVALFGVFSILTSQLEALGEALPGYQAKLAALTQSISHRFELGELPSANRIFAQLDMGKTLGFMSDTLGGLVGNLALIALYLGFILAEEGIFANKLANISQDPDRSRRLVALASEVNRRIQQYIGMKSAISLLTSLLGYALLRVVGVDFAALWALLIFLLNFIPNIGSLLAMVLPSLMALFQFDGLTAFIIVAGGLTAINFLIGNILEPAYMGRSLNLSPLMILLSLSIWGAIWGLAGMFLAIPLMVVTAIICSHFEGLRWVAVVLSESGELGET